MNIAVIFAGGTGTRMKSGKTPKQFLELDGEPILIRTIMNFERHREIDAIAVVCLESWIDQLKILMKKSNIQKVRWIVSGGETGQQSIYNGLRAVADEIGIDKETIVLLNDGVRPIVSQEIISENIACVKKNGSSVTVCPVSETIVEINESGEIVHIPIRKNCYLSKAPQGFYLKELLEAHEKSILENRFDCTNSAELMKRYGHSLYVVYDTEKNMKITTPIDLKLLELYREETE